MNDIYYDYLHMLRQTPGLIDFVYPAYNQVAGDLGQLEAVPAAPFDKVDSLPPYSYAQPRRRSVVFLHSAYYHYKFLGAALRRRGWDVLTVSLLPPDHPDQQFLHGDDLNLHDPDPDRMVERTRAFLATVPERFGAVQFYSQGVGSFFPANQESSADPRRMPWDFMELRRHRLIIGNTPSGCMDGPRQSSIHALADGLCDRCIWQLRPDVCNDEKNYAWTRKLHEICDWVGLEADWATPERVGPMFVKHPVITAMDPQLWSPDIEPPDDMRLERAPGEILIYHAVGNYDARRAAGRDLKGTGAVIAAVETLKAEGLPVRLVFATDVPSTKVRYLQVQADIVVDQLNYGRLGANAREALMLGKPLVARRLPSQAPPLPPFDYILDSPTVDASEDTLVNVLRGLVVDAGLRAALGKRGREFALRWHDADGCAARFEAVIDRVAAGLPADGPQHA